MQFRVEYYRNEQGMPRSRGKFVVVKQSDTEGVIHAGQFEQHKYVPLQGAKRSSIIGAGDFNKEVVVRSWDSVGYDITTPLGLRQPIQDALTAHKDLIVVDKWI